MRPPGDAVRTTEPAKQIRLTLPHGTGFTLLPMARDGLLIGEVAAKSGVSRKALRLYEKAGILPPSRRTASGYRVYGPETLALLGFVTQARWLRDVLFRRTHTAAQVIVHVMKSQVATHAPSVAPNSPNETRHP